MKRGVVVVSLLAGSALWAACFGGARRGRPGPAPTAPPVVSDTFAQRLLREQRAREREDSIRRAHLPPESVAVAKVPAPPAAGARTPGGAPPPAQRCVLDFPNTDTTRGQRVQDPVSGKYTYHLGAGIRGNCRAQDITIVADSMEGY